MSYRNTTVAKHERIYRNLPVLTEGEYRVLHSNRYKDICPDGKIFIFTKSQADELGIKYYPVSEWYKGKRGDWIETYDRHVIQVLNRNDNPKFPYMRTIFATYVLTKRGIAYHSRRKDVNTKIRERKSTVGHKVVPSDKRLSEKQQTFAAMVSANILAYGRPDYQKCADLAYGREVSRIEWERIVLSRKFQEELVMNLKTAMQQAGIDDSWGYRQLKGMVERESTPDDLKYKIIMEVLFHQGVVLSSQVKEIVGSVNPNSRQMNSIEAAIAGDLQEIGEGDGLLNALNEGESEDREITFE